MGRIALLACMILVLTSGCVPASKTIVPAPDRESLIALDQAKITPDMDVHPPLSFSPEYDDPVPLPHPVNTAGAEDSAFITPDGMELFLWFSPDITGDLQVQLHDGATGIYSFRMTDAGWSDAERVLLQRSGKLALDGCEFVQDDTMWFCSAREGYTGVHWFTAQRRNGEWRNWKEAGFEPSHEVGELHITADGSELYFHSSRPGGQGGFDIWLSRQVDGEWSEPENVQAVNTSYTDGWPFVSEDGSELWITRGNGAPELWRSRRVNGSWTEPEKMFGPFAGEASLDNEGNVYFTHHFYKDDVMLEADIYVARPKQG